MSETKNLRLFKHNEPLETNENKFDIDLALNQNWDKIEEFAGMVNDKVIELEDKDEEQDFNLQELQNEIKKDRENMINLEVEGQSIHIEDSSDLEGQFEDKDEEQDFNLQELQNEIKKDRENMINLEVEGQSIHIEDSSDLEGQLEVLGNVEQEVREGYNLYDYMTKVLATANGLTITKDIKNGYLIANGTQKGDYMSICNLTDITDNLKDKTTYTLWQEKYDNKLYLQVVGTKKDDTGNTRFYSASQKTTFTVDKSKYNRYTINIQTGLTTQAGTFSNYKNRYMLYEGTDDKPYEQYGASPSPEYPSEIRAVGDNINLFNKEQVVQGSANSKTAMNRNINLFNKEQVVQGSANSKTAMNRNSIFLKKVKKGEKYTSQIFNSNLNYAIAITDTNTQADTIKISQDSGWLTGNYTINCESDGYLYQMAIYIWE